VLRFLPRESVSLNKCPDFDMLTKDFDFTEGERQVLRMIDGRKTLAELINMFKVGRLSIHGFFFGLFTMKLIRLAPQEKVAPVTTEPVEEEVVKENAVREEVVAEKKRTAAPMTVWATSSWNWKPMPSCTQTS